MAASLVLGSMMGTQQGYTFNINEAQVKTNQGHGPSPGFAGQSTHGRGMVTGLLQGPSLYPGVVQGPSLYPGVVQGPSLYPGVVQGPSLYPGVVQSSTVPIGSFAPICTRPSNQHPSPGQIQQSTPSQPVHYAAPVQFLQAPHIQTLMNEFAAQAPVHYASRPPVQFLSAPGPQHIQSQLKQFAAQAPVHYAAPQQVQVLPAPGLQKIQPKQLPIQAPIHYAAPGRPHIQSQLNEFAANAPVHYAAAQPAQVLPTPGLQNIQLKQLPRQAPIHYAASGRPHIQSQLNQFAANASVLYGAAQPAQFLPAPGPQQIQLKQFATQAPVHYATPVEVQQAPGPQQTPLNEFAAQAPVHYATPVGVQQAPGPQQTPLTEFAAQAPVHYGAPPAVQGLSAPGPQQIQLKQFAAQAPVHYAAPPAVQGLSAPGPQKIQLNQFAAPAPVHYAAPPAVQGLSAPCPQQIKPNQFAAQVPVNYAAPLPVQVKQGAGLHNIRNVFAAQVPVYHAASLPVHAGLLPRQVAPSLYFEAERKQQIAPLVPGLQNVQVQELPTLQYQNQTHLDENQNLFPSSDFVRMTPAEQSVRSMRENSESDEGMSSMGVSVEASPQGMSSVGESVQASPYGMSSMGESLQASPYGMSSMGESVETSPYGISSVGESVQASPHTPNINEARNPRRKRRSPAAEVKQYKRLLTFQEKLVFEKGLPKSRLQIEFESGINLISPRPAHELGIKPISTASPFKPSDAVPVCSRSLMGDADGLEVSPLNLISSKPGLDCPPESNDLKPEQISHPVSNYLKPAGTEGHQERHVENPLGQGQENSFPSSFRPGYIIQGDSKISEAWLRGYESGLRVRGKVYCHGCNNYGSVVPVVFDV